MATEEEHGDLVCETKVVLYTLGVEKLTVPIDEMRQDRYPFTTAISNYVDVVTVKEEEPVSLKKILTLLKDKTVPPKPSVQTSPTPHVQPSKELMLSRYRAR